MKTLVLVLMIVSATLSARGTSDSLVDEQKQLWGMTALGGANNDGVIYKIDRQGSKYVVKHSFVAQGPNNSRPNASLVQASNSKLYGVTYYGGVDDCGTIFEFDPPTGAFSVRAEFSGLEKGRYPNGNLVEAADGNLYGLTAAGGDSDVGVIFRFNPTTGDITKLFSFDAHLRGKTPMAALLIAKDGKLYGMTSLGGTKDQGVIFSYDIAKNEESTLASFDEAVNGSNPYGSLVQADDGMMYGLCYTGGTNNAGTLFQFNPTTALISKKIEFDNADNGGNPTGTLFAATDGLLYGVAQAGGSHSAGILFSYDPVTSAFSKKVDFDEQPNGSVPLGSLVQNIDGLLFGMCSMGGKDSGPLSLGTLFTYDIGTNTLNTRLQFDGSNGANPEYTNLIEIPVTIKTSTDAASPCVGAMLHVSYTIAGAYDDDNVFSVQLSDADGSFANPVVIGSSSTSQAGSIDATIPISTPAGSHYRVRVVATGPVVIGSDNGSDVVINALPEASITVSGDTLDATLAGMAYAWYNCASMTAPISGATNQRFIVAESGDYAVQVTNPGTGCSALSSCVNVISSEVDNNSANEWSLRPNPARSVLTLVAPNDLPYSVDLISARGQEVVHMESQTTQWSIPVDFLPAGVYALVIHSSKGASIVKTWVKVD